MELWEFQTMKEFLEYFDSEDSCVDVLFSLKWSSGFECPRCFNREYTVIQTRRLPLYQCRSCNHQTSLTVGTIMEKSRTSIRKWLTAIWLVVQPNFGLNAVKLSSLISVTYKTAWLMLNKIRYSIGLADTEESLCGFVGGISSFYGKPYNPTVLLHGQEHPMIIAASLDPDGELKYLKAKLVPRELMSDRYVTTPALRSFIDQHTMTSQDQMVITRKRSQITSHNPFKAISKQISSWINHTFHGIGRLYLQDYLDQYCFHINVKQQRVFAPWELLASYCLKLRT